MQDACIEALLQQIAGGWQRSSEVRSLEFKNSKEHCCRHKRSANTSTTTNLTRSTGDRAYNSFTNSCTTGRTGNGQIKEFPRSWGPAKLDHVGTMVTAARSRSRHDPFCIDPWKGFWMALACMHARTHAFSQPWRGCLRFMCRMCMA